MPEHIVDFHIHSHYAYATSKDMNLTEIYRWSKIKGISVVGTGDCLHPSWLDELGSRLQPAEQGLYQLSPEYAEYVNQQLPTSVRTEVHRFCITTEVSLIYRRHEKVRKVHVVLVFSSLEKAREFAVFAAQYGNLAADGRPTLSIDAKDILESFLQIDPDGLYIPAHIWTPWFGVFGSKSGFDSLEEAYGELADEVYGIETGLSSDPAMNLLIPELRERAIISNSDAHSPQNLGREATVFNCELKLEEIIAAVKTNDHRLVGTIEFYPEEGKYYADGHRKCDVCSIPDPTSKQDTVCSVCGKQLTIGVLSRVQSLSKVAEQRTSQVSQKRIEYIIPLTEIIAEQLGVKSTKSKRVQKQYLQLIAQFGNEFQLLRTTPLTKLKQHSLQLATAIENMRTGNVYRTPGYDGEYGKISVAAGTEELPQTSSQQATLF